MHYTAAVNVHLLALHMEKDPNFNIATIPRKIVFPYAQYYDSIEYLMPKYAHLIPINEPAILTDFITNIRYNNDYQQALRILEQLLKMKLPLDSSKIATYLKDKYVSEQVKKGVQKLLLQYGYKV